MSNYCVLPFIGLETAPMGQARACCLYEGDLHNNGELLNFSKNTVQETFHSSDMNELRAAFLRDEKPKGCAKCWAVEEAGGVSKRIISNQKYKDFVGIEKPTLKFIDLKLGNICNLKCRICGVFSSSKWANDELKLNDSPGHKAHIVEMNRAGQWPREAENFWQDIKELANDIDSLEITGGEPFLIEEHFEFLRHCVETGNAHRIDIHYNTNGTVFPQDAIENIWPHFKRVEVAFSIDGLGEQFEYQREGAKWDQVTENIRKFHEVRNNAQWLTTQLCTTINTLNIMDVVDVLEWAEGVEFDFIWVNILHTARHFCVKTMHADAKNKVKQHLEQQRARLKTQDAVRQLNSLIEFMMLPDEDLTKELVYNLKRVDKVRNQNWRTALPKLARLIDE